MAPDTTTILAEQPATLPVFLIIVAVLSWAAYRHRYELMRAVAGLTVLTLVPTFVLLFLYAFTGDGAWEGRAQLVLHAAAFLVLLVVRIVDAVVAGALMTFELVASGIWVGVVWFLQGAAIPVVSANEFLFLVFAFQLVAGAGSLCAVYLWSRSESRNAVTNAVLGAAGIVFFVTGMFVSLVYAQVWSVGEATLLGALVVAPFGHSLGVISMIIVFQPDFSKGQVKLVDWSEDEAEAGTTDDVADIDDVVASVRSWVSNDRNQDYDRGRDRE